MGLARTPPPTKQPITLSSSPIKSTTSRTPITSNSTSSNHKTTEFNFNLKPIQNTFSSNSKNQQIKPIGTLIPKPTIPPLTPNQPKRFVSNDLNNQDPFKKISKLQRSPTNTTQQQDNQLVEDNQLQDDQHQPDHQHDNQQEGDQDKDDREEDDQDKDNRQEDDQDRDNRQEDDQQVPLPSPPAISNSRIQSTTSTLPHSIPEIGHSQQHHLIKPSSIPVLIRPPSPTKLIHDERIPIPSTSTYQDHRIGFNHHSSELTERLHHHQSAELHSPVKHSSSTKPLLTRQTSSSTVGIHQPPKADSSNRLKEELTKIQIESKLQREKLLENQNQLISQSTELLNEIEKRKKTEERLNLIEISLNEKIKLIDQLECTQSLMTMKNKSNIDDQTTIELSTDTLLVNNVEGLNEKEKQMYEDRIHQLESQVESLEYINKQIALKQKVKEHEIAKAAIWGDTGLNLESNQIETTDRSIKMSRLEHQHDLVRSNTLIQDLESQLKLSFVDQDLLRLRLKEQEEDHQRILEKVTRFQSDVNLQNKRLLSELNQLNIKDQEWARIGSEFEGLLEIERREKEQLKKCMEIDKVEPKIELNSLKYEFNKLETQLNSNQIELKKMETKLNLSEIENQNLKTDLSNSENRNKSLEEELKISKNKFNELLTENQSLLHTHQTLNQTHELTLTELEETHLTVNEMEEQIATLNRQLRISQKESRRHSNSLQSIRKSDEFINRNRSNDNQIESLKKAEKGKVGKKPSVSKKPIGRSKKPTSNQIESKTNEFEGVIPDSELEEEEEGKGIDFNRMITNGGWISISGCISKPDRPPKCHENEEEETDVEKEPTPPPPPPPKATRGRKKGVTASARVTTTKPVKGRPRKKIIDPILVKDDDETIENLGKASTPLMGTHNSSIISEPDPLPSPNSPAALCANLQKRKGNPIDFKGKGKAKVIELDDNEDDDVERNVGLGKRNREDVNYLEEEVPLKKMKGRTKKIKEHEEEEKEGVVKKGVKKGKVSVNKKKVLEEEEEEEEDDDDEEVENVKVIHKNVKPRARGKVGKKKMVEVEDVEIEDGHQEEGESKDNEGIGNLNPKKRKIFNLKNNHRLISGIGLVGNGNRVLNWNSGNLLEDLDNDQNMLGLPPELSPVKKH